MVRYPLPAAAASQPSGAETVAIPGSKDLVLDATKLTHECTGTNHIQRIDKTGFSPGQQVNLILVNGSTIDPAGVVSGNLLPIKTISGAAEGGGANTCVPLVLNAAGTAWQTLAYPAIANG